jgi:hypothetical protein
LKFGTILALAEKGMEKIKEFEKQMWELVSKATEKKDSANLAQLTNILNDIKRLKAKARKIEAVVDKLADRVKRLGLQVPVVQGVKSVSWAVSHSDIMDNALSVEKAIAARLIPMDGNSFVVQTSLGQVFKTDVVSEEKRLREHDKIKEFYRGEAIKAGAKIIWTKTSSDRYLLEKAS